MRRLLLTAIREVLQGSLMQGWALKEASIAAQAVHGSLPSSRWLKPVRGHVVPVLNRVRVLSTASSGEVQPMPRAKPRPHSRSTTSQPVAEPAKQLEHSLQQHTEPGGSHRLQQPQTAPSTSTGHAQQRPALPAEVQPNVEPLKGLPNISGQPNIARQQLPHLASDQPSAQQVTASSSALPQQAEAVQQGSVVAPKADSNSQAAALAQAGVEQTVINGQPGVTQMKRPRPRRSTSSAAPSPVDGSQATAGHADNQQQGSSSQPSTGVQLLQPAAAAAPPAPATTTQQLRDPNMRLRNKFGTRKPAQELVPPTQPLSAAAAEWLRGLGIESDDWAHWWGAGMAQVQHPDTLEQVEVLALPYYCNNKLVDVRYLQLEHGRLVRSWLALGAGALFMKDNELQDASRIVFVNCELDVILLWTLGFTAVAVPRQWPVEYSTAATAAAPPLQQQQQQWGWQQQQQQWGWQQQQQQQQPQHQQQQYQHQQHLLPVMQLAVQRQQQQYAGSLPGAEDPRLRLEGLRVEIDKRRHEDNVKASRNQKRGSREQDTSDEGYVVTDVTKSDESGLRLLFPAAKDAVIAMDSGPVGGALGSELAKLLGEVHCTRVMWPDTAPADAAAAVLTAAAAGAPADQSAGLVQDTAAAAAVHYISRAAGAEGVLPAAESSDSYTATAAVASGSVTTLAHQLVNAGINSWNLMLVSSIQGPAGVARCIDDATIWPIPGLERFTDHAAELLDIYTSSVVDNMAVSTGWPSLDAIYKVAPGEVTLVTGVPNSGKSEWLDALAVNLAHQHNWRFAVCSMEKRPRDHARQLVEKIAGKPMLRAAYAENVDRMTQQELVKAYKFLSRHFVVIVSGEDKMPSVQWVLEKARAAKIRYGINGLIIDPYNELDPTRANSSIKEHEHVNELMSNIRRFARDNQVHCWLVAHPRQMANAWSGQRPGLQDISGGANFMNKADNGIVVHRDWSKMKELQERLGKGKKPARKGSRSGSPEPDEQAAGAAANETANSTGSASGEGSAAADGSGHQPEFEVQVFVEKVRNKTTGCRGDCLLVYDRVTGRYHEIGEQPDRAALGEQLVRQDDPDSGQLEVEDVPDGESTLQQAEEWPESSNSSWVGSSNGRQEQDQYEQEMAFHGEDAFS